MKKVLKSILGLSLMLTVLFGSGTQAKAEQTSVNWTEGWSHIMQEGEIIRVELDSEEHPMDVYIDGILRVSDEMEASVIDPSQFPCIGIRYIECKFTPEGKRGIYLYTSVPEVPESNSPATASPSCSDHNYEWATTREATATAAGEKAYQCTKCSHIESYAEVSGYLAFNEDAMNSIRNAAANGTVTVDTKMWVSFHKSVFDTLGTRKDVAVTVNFKHEGKNYTTTIPAGADLTGLTDENGFSGFLNLMAKFGGSEIVK